MSDTHEPLVSADEIAQLLGLEKQTVLVWAREGRIPCVRPTQRVVRFLRSAVLNAVGTAPETVA